jgi:tetratricopeptide (TPR) repeat protein
MDTPDLIRLHHNRGGGPLPLVAAAVVVCVLALVETPSAAPVFLSATAPIPIPQEAGENQALEAGLRALRDGDAAMAVTFLRSSAASEEALENEAWIGLGMAYRNLGRPASAATALERGEEKLTEPLLGWVRFERARLLLAAGEPDRADSLLAALSSPDVGSPASTGRVSSPVIEEVLEFRLEQAIASGDEDRERALIERIVDLGIGNAAGYAARLAELVQTEDSDEAGRLRRLALELPGSDEARGRSAAALLDDTSSLNVGELLETGQILFGLANWSGAADAFRLALDRAGADQENV